MGNGVPSSLEPDLEVVQWKNKTHYDPVSLNVNQHALIAWCRGTAANVYQFKDKTDYDNCNIVDKKDKAPWDGINRLRGFLINTTVEGPQYFANGVEDNCETGWKIMIN